MRTTVDLPPAVHARALDLARSRGQSLSSVLAELTARGLSHLDEPLLVTLDERSGLPVMSLGRPITSEDVADIVADE